MAAIGSGSQTTSNDSPATWGLDNKSPLMRRGNPGRVTPRFDVAGGSASATLSRRYQQAPNSFGRRWLQAFTRGRWRLVAA
jgi:hypothetical protein